MLPCRGCGGDKGPVGSGGYAYCPRCQEERDRLGTVPRKPCRRCGGEKGPPASAGGHTWWCARCVAENGDRVRHADYIGLPVRPLALAISRLIEREHALYGPRLARRPGAEEDKRLDVYERAGVSMRQLLRWQVGETSTVDLYKAIEILDRLKLGWWDVWTEESMRLPMLAVRVYGEPMRKNNRRYRHLLRVVLIGDLGPDLEGLEAVRTEMNRTEPAKAAA